MIKISNGDFIARQDADDYSLPIRLETQLKMMEKFDIKFQHQSFTTNKEIPGLSFYIPYRYLIYFKIHLYTEL